MAPPTDTNVTIALQHMNDVFYAVRAEMLKAGQVNQWSGMS
jgi:hypothetical protein